MEQKKLKTFTTGDPKYYACTWTDVTSASDDEVIEKIKQFFKNLPKEPKEPSSGFDQLI